ncbi:MAG: spore cortex-lytic enzyme [Clostridia bacterium]
MKINKKQTVYYIGKILIVVLINLLFITMLYHNVYAVSKIGSQGTQVREIQTALQDLGYFTDTVDGIFGSKTQSALISFQNDYGLTADGIAGTNTLKALGITSSTDNSGGYGGMSESDFQLLARIISAEARGEPYEGQVAVGAVILNRIAHPSFPDTLSGVIYQSGAFSCVDDGGINAEVADSAYQAAREAINGSDPSGGAIYYYNPAKATSKWIFSRPVITVIGEHLFCL